MRRFLTAALAALSLGLPNGAAAEEATALTTLMTAYQAQGWEGVGRLNIGRTGMCTGALVAPDSCSAAPAPRVRSGARHRIKAATPAAQ